MAKQKKLPSQRKSSAPSAPKKRVRKDITQSPRQNVYAPPGPPPEEPPEEYLIRAEDIEKFFARIVEYMTVRRTIQYTVVALAILLPITFFVRRDALSKARADRLFDQGHYQEAGEIYAKYLDDPDRDLSLALAEASIAAARCQLETMASTQTAIAATLPLLDRAQANIDIVEDRVKKKELSIELHVLRGWALIKSSDRAEGIKELDMALSLNKKHPLGNYIKGGYFQLTNQLLKAAPHFRMLNGLPEYAKAVEDFQAVFSKAFLEIPESALEGIPVHKPRPTPPPTPTPPPKPKFQPTPTPKIPEVKPTTHPTSPPAPTTKTTVNPTPTPTPARRTPRPTIPPTPTPKR